MIDLEDVPMFAVFGLLVIGAFIAIGVACGGLVGGFIWTVRWMTGL